jgi:chromosome segregation ATPase
MSRFIEYRKRKAASTETLVRLCESQRKKIEELKAENKEQDFQLEQTHDVRAQFSVLRDEIKELRKQTPEGWYEMELTLSETQRKLSDCRKEYNKLLKQIKDEKEWK